LNCALTPVDMISTLLLMTVTLGDEQGAACVGDAPAWCANWHGGPEPFANCTGSSELSALECSAWQTLYDSLNGTKWAYGSAHRNDPCALHRQGGGNGERDAIVYCNGGNILSVDLQENKMHGEVPAAIGDLTSLLFINLGANHIYGALPDTMSKLVNLESMYFGGDKTQKGKFGLSGPLPTWLPALTKLHSLNLAINKFTGSIPADLGNLKLEVLYLYDNQLRGAVPAINFDRIKYCGIGSSHDGLGRNEFCTPLPAGAKDCRLEGSVDVSGPCN